MNALLAAALAATALAHGVQLVFLWRPVSMSFYLSHLILVAAVQAVVVLTAGSRGAGRVWAGAVFALPVTLAMVPIVHGFAGVAGASAVVAGAVAAVALWAARGAGGGAPLVAAPLGALLGAHVARFHRDFYHGVETAAGPVLALILVGVVALGATVYAGGRVGRLRLPRPITSLALALLALVVSAGLSVTSEPWPAFEPPRGVASTGGPPPTVLVVLDTVRADHLKAYGYERDTMPRLEAFAREHGVRVERALSTSSWTLPAHASIFTGLYPPRHRAHKPFVDDEDPPYAYPLRRGLPSLAGLLGEHGLWTVGITSNFGFTAPAFGLGRGFHDYRAVRNRVLDLRSRTPWHPQTDAASALAALDALSPFAGCEFFGGVHYRRAEDITDEALAFLQAAGERSFFVFLNYMDAHNPYHPPPAFLDRFEGRVPALGKGLQTDVLLDPVEVAAGRKLSDAERAHLAALYDGELAYLDTQLGRLLDALQSHPRFDELLVVITSDHGEALGEHGVLGHDLELYDPMARVPLFIKPGAHTPGAPPAGSVLGGLVQLVDIFPLVLKHAGVPVPPGVDGVAWGRGRTMAPAWLYASQGRWYPNLPARFARELRSLERDGMKLIVSGNGNAQLYDLSADPGETNDLSSESPELVEQLLAELDALAPNEVRATLRNELDMEEVREQLEALGYIGR